MGSLLPPLRYPHPHLQHLCPCSVTRQRGSRAADGMKSVNQLASGRGDDPALSGGPNNHQGLYKPQGVGGEGRTRQTSRRRAWPGGPEGGGEGSRFQEPASSLSARGKTRILQIPPWSPRKERSADTTAPSVQGHPRLTSDLQVTRVSCFVSHQVCGNYAAL